MLSDPYVTRQIRFWASYREIRGSQGSFRKALADPQGPVSCEERKGLPLRNEKVLSSSPCLPEHGSRSGPC
ncbi:General transcriptional corepressor trfA [Fusarium oxysporum f. sp. albedinis]|nr:General transcriptional corepressor trfA [Fusarium oxysporum f. sp. albedinis]